MSEELYEIFALKNTNDAFCSLITNPNYDNDQYVPKDILDYLYTDSHNTINHIRVPIMKKIINRFYELYYFILANIDNISPKYPNFTCMCPDYDSVHKYISAMILWANGTTNNDKNDIILAYPEIIPIINECTIHNIPDDAIKQGIPIENILSYNGLLPQHSIEAFHDIPHNIANLYKIHTSKIDQMYKTFNNDFVNDVATNVSNYHNANKDQNTASYSATTIATWIKNTYKLTGGSHMEDYINILVDKIPKVKQFASELVIYAFILTLINKYAIDDILYNTTLPAVYDTYRFEDDEINSNNDDANENPYIQFNKEILSIRLIYRKILSAAYLLSSNLVINHYRFILADASSIELSGNCAWHATAHACLFNDINPYVPFNFIFSEIRALNVNKEITMFTDDDSLYPKFQRYSFIGGLFTIDYYRNYMLSKHDYRNYISTSNPAVIVKSMMNNDENIINISRILSTTNDVSISLCSMYDRYSKIILSYIDPKIVNTMRYKYLSGNGNCDTSDYMLKRNATIPTGVATEDVGPTIANGHAQCVTYKEFDEQSVWDKILVNQNASNFKLENVHDKSLYEIEKRLNVNMIGTIEQFNDEFACHVLYILCLLNVSNGHDNHLDVYLKRDYYNTMLYLIDVAYNNFYHNRLAFAGKIGKWFTNKVKCIVHSNNIIKDCKTSCKNIYARDIVIDDIKNKIAAKAKQAITDSTDYYKIYTLRYRDNSRFEEHANTLEAYNVLYIGSPNDWESAVPINVNRHPIINDPNYVLDTGKLCCYDICAPWNAKSIYKNYISKRNNTTLQLEITVNIIISVVANVYGTCYKINDPFKQHSLNNISYEIKLFKDDGEIATKTPYDIAVEKIKAKILLFENDLIKKRYYQTQLYIITTFNDMITSISNVDFDYYNTDYVATQLLDTDPRLQHIMHGGYTKNIIKTTLWYILYLAIVVIIIVTLIYVYNHIQLHLNKYTLETI